MRLLSPVLFIVNQKDNTCGTVTQKKVLVKTALYQVRAFSLTITRLSLSLLRIRTSLNIDPMITISGMTEE
jgi:hypothetical protein